MKQDFFREFLKRGVSCTGRSWEGWTGRTGQTRRSNERCKPYGQRWEWWERWEWCGSGGRAWERWEGVGTVWEIAPEPPKGDKLQMGGIEGCIKNNLCQSFDSFYAINFGKGCEPQGQFLDGVILLRRIEHLKYPSKLFQDYLLLQNFLKLNDQ